MEYLDSALIVFAVLIAVAIAAVMFEPAKPLENWHRLAERYGTTGQPSEAQFMNQDIRFGGQRGGLRPLNPYVSFDVAIDDFGLWLVCRGLEDPNISAAIRVPGTHVRPAGRRGRGHVFDLYAEPPVRIAVAAELGNALLQKSQTGAS